MLLSINTFPHNINKIGLISKFMTLTSFLKTTLIIYSMNGSLDYLLNDNYNSAKAAVNPHIIDYMINKDNPNYMFGQNIYFEKSNSMVDKK